MEKRKKQTNKPIAQRVQSHINRCKKKIIKTPVTVNLW